MSKSDNGDVFAAGLLLGIFLMLVINIAFNWGDTSVPTTTMDEVCKTIVDNTNVEFNYVDGKGVIHCEKVTEKVYDSGKIVLDSDKE